MKLFSKKNKKVEKEIEVVKEVEPEIISVVEAQPEEIKKEEVKLEVVSKPKTPRKKAPKTNCRVLLAKPSYFVIMKNGEQITVKKKNKCHKNQERLY